MFDKANLTLNSKDEYFNIFMPMQQNFFCGKVELR